MASRTQESGTMAVLLARSAPPETGTYLRDVLGLALLVVQGAFTVWIVPDWSVAHLAEPPYLGALAGVMTTLALFAIRLRGKRGSRAELHTLGLFLAGMPLVYIASWLVAPQTGWLPIELAAVPIFGALAWLGITRSPWFLAGGIAAHGLLWDLWHHHQTTFVPNWYVIGCLLVDVALGAYVALEVPHLRRATTQARRARSETPSPASAP